MKYILIISIIFCFTLFVYSNDKIEINYLNGIQKISMDGGITWKSKLKRTPIIQFNRLDGSSAITYNFGKTWNEKIPNNNATRFNYMNGSSIVTYDNGRSWFFENTMEDIFINNTFSRIIINKSMCITLDIDSKIDFQINILDKTGNILENLAFKSCSDAISINLSRLNPGLYLVQYKSETELKYLGKFIF